MGPGDSFYLSYWLKYDANFDYGSTTGFKTLIVFSQNVHDYIYIVQNNSGKMVVFIQDTQAWQPAFLSNVNGNDYVMPLGVWIKFEWYFVVSPHSAMQGVIKGWVNDELRWDYSGVATVEHDSSVLSYLELSYTFNATHPFNDTQKRYWDLFSIGPGQPALLRSEGSTNATGQAVDRLTPADAERMTVHALTTWAQFLQFSHVPEIVVVVADLPAGELGQAWADTNTIMLDVNADGAGWFVDLTPWESSEFVGYNPVVSGKMDLLTVVTHEIGHLLGLRHSMDTHDVMADTLPVGTRRLPGAAAVVAQDPPRLSPDSRRLLLVRQRNAREDGVVDHAADRSDSRETDGADIDIRLLPLALTIHPERSPSGLEAWEVRLLQDALDEETALIDDELLDLIALIKE